MKETKGSRVAREARFLAKKLEVVRKAWHMINGSIAGLVYLFLLDEPTAVFLTFWMAIGFTGLEVVRFSSDYLRDCRLHHFLLARLGRHDERRSISSMFYFSWGIYLTVLFLPKSSAIAVIFMLAFGDPLASLAGKWGKLLNQKLMGSSRLWVRTLGWIGYRSAGSVKVGGVTLGKSLMGAGTNFMVCSLIGFLRYHHLGIACAVGLIVSLAEFISLRGKGLFRLDDNFTIPVGGTIAVRFLAY